MSRRKFTAEQIINHLRTIEALISQGKTAASACREVQVTEQTYYRWRKEYGEMQTSQAKKIKRPRTRKRTSKKGGCGAHFR